MKLAILLSAFVVLQLVAVSICASRLRKAVFRSPLLGAALVLIIIESLCAISLVLGAYSESRWQAIAWIEDIVLSPAVSPKQEIDRRGDPGLLSTLDAQEPVIPPPDVADREAFHAWQGKLRTHLIDDIFSIPRVSEPEQVRFTVENETTLDN